MIRQSKISVFLILATSVLLAGTGISNRPGIGIFAALIVIAVVLWRRGEGLAVLGYRRPTSWWRTVVFGFVCSLAIYVLATLIFEPLSEIATRTPHDYSSFNGIRGNWVAAIQLVLIVWIFVAFVEETIFRGFLMTEIAKVTGKSTSALVFSVAFTSLTFGLSHAYQGWSGVFSTAGIGALLACVFVSRKYSLWEGIVAHGFVDTIGIILIATNGDIYIRQKILSLLWTLP